LDKTSSGIQTSYLSVFCTDSAPQHPSLRAGSQYLDTFCLKDTSGAVLSFHFADSVSGLSMNNYIVSWTPNESDSGIHPVSIVASDGLGGFDTLSWTVTVVPNHAPVFDTAHPRYDTAVTGRQFRDSIGVHDPDSDSIALSIVHGLAHMTLNGNILSFTPSASDSGTTAVSIAADDGHGGNDTLTFSLMVSAADRPPVFLSSAAGMKDVAYINEEYRDTVHATDPDNDTIRFSMATPVPGVQITDSILVWTPSWSDFNNTVAVTLYASDGRDGIDTLQWKIHVTERLPFIISTPSVMDTHATVGREYRDTIRYVEGDGEELSFMDSVAGMQIANNSIILWMPAARDTGMHVVSVILTSNGTKCDSLRWNMTVLPQAVTPVHVPYVVSPPSDTSISAEKQYTAVFPDTDKSGNFITYTLSTFISDMTLSNNVLTWTPGPTDTGVNTISITANNHKDVSSSTSWNVTVVYKPNHTPQFTTTQTKAADTVKVGSLETFVFTATDQDSDIISYSLQAPSSGMAITAARTFTWTPLVSDTGLHSVNIIASDGKGGSATLSWNIFVDALNHAPVFIADEIFLDTQILTGKNYRASFHAVDSDNDPVTYSLVSTINGMTITDTAILWTPAIADTGVHSVSVRASDGKGGTATLTWNVDVVPANHAPHFISKAVDFPTTIYTGELFTAVLSASDPDGDQLTYSIVTGPAGMILQNNSTLSYSPGAPDVGSHEVKVMIEDGKGGSDTLTFTISIAANQ
jgi:large repetitive protein